MAKSKEQLEIEKLKLKLKRERENRRHLEDQYEQNKFLLQNAKEDIERLVFQVTHDLRAPITVLGQLVEDIIPKLPFERRNVFLSSIARVQDISNEVLKKHKADETSDGVDFTKHTVDVISQTSSLVQEKRVLFEENENLDIEMNLNGLDNEPQLANIREMEFNCILSNLLVNSIEAIEQKGEKGLITVDIQKTNDFYFLIFTDNGIGIKEEDLEKIGRYRVTLKEKGNGLGLYSCIHFLNKRGGTFNIESKHNEGTKVTITIPVAEKKVQKITLKNDGLLVLLDDDFLVHETFRNFLDDTNYKGEVLNFYSEEDFRDWFKYSAPTELERAFFVVDGFIDSKHPNGPEIIKDLKIGPQAILYTGKPNLISKTGPEAPVFDKSSNLAEILQIN